MSEHDVGCTLMDPLNETVPFNDGDIIISKASDFQYILETNEPDKDLEYFWLTFKDSIINHVGEKNKINIHKFSSTLNDLQKNKKYDDIHKKISKFMIANINIIIKYIIRTNDYTVHLLNTNIKRWRKFDVLFDNMANENEFIQFSSFFEKIQKKKSNHKDQADEIKKLIKELLDTKSDDAQEIRMKLFDIAIEFKLSSLLDILLKNIDMELYFGENAAKYKIMSSDKIIKELRQTDGMGQKIEK